MKFFITFALFFLASYIVCQSILSRNVSTSSVNGVTTTIETVVWNNGSTVVTRTVTSGSSTTKTVTVTPTGSGSGSGSAQLIGTSTNTQNVNGVITVTVVNTYNNATTVTIKTVTQGNTITKTTTVASPFGTNTWTSVTTGGSPSTTSTTGGSPSTPRPSTPAPSTPRPSTPAPSTPRPSTPAPSTPRPSTPAPSTPAPSTPAPTTSGSNTQNPVTLASSDPYSKFNYKVPSSISYAEIRNVHMEYINGARDCVGVNNATWDDTLAAHAQAWANTCQVFHANGGTSPANPSGNSDTVGEGENIYTFSGSNLRAVDAMVKGNEFFNKESKDFNCAGNSCSGVCGHYTQNVWYKTTKIGCGVAQCNGGFYGVCRYFPRGNFNQNTVHPFGSANNCNKGVGSARNQGYDSCKARISATGRSLTANGAVQSQTTTQTTATNTNTNKSAPFFNSDSQIVVFALAIVITVIVAACFIVLVVIAKRNSHKELDYQLLESK